MANEWPDVRLGDVAGEITVGWVGPMTDEYLDVGIPFLRSLNVAPYRIDPGDLKYISTQFHMRIGKSRLRPGDLVVVRTGRPGTAAVIPPDIDEANCSDLVIVRPSDQLDTRYAMYYLNSHMGRNSVDARLVGSVQHHFNIGDAKSLTLKLPPIDEQRAIARILGAIDDKIDLNRRMNDTLEAIARALFQSWFVDFDPVRAKAEGRQPIGMDADTAALFPDAFEEASLGPIPLRWRVLTLGEASSYLNRGFQPTYIANGDGVLVLNQKCVRGHRVNLNEARRHDHGARPIAGRELQLGDILVNSTGTGTLGRVAQLLHLPESAIVDSHVTVVRADPNVITGNLLGVALEGREPEIEELAEGSTGQTELSRDRMRALLLLIPDMTVQRAFDRLTVPLRQRISSNDREAEALAAIRDALLPKLLSGEVRVKAAETLVEAVV